MSVQNKSVYSFKMKGCVFFEDGTKVYLEIGNCVRHECWYVMSTKRDRCPDCYVETKRKVEAAHPELIVRDGKGPYSKLVYTPGFVTK